jgi:anaerobic selenocysteine-containing dehydrogenase
MERREFIRLTAIGGAGATLASCGHPEAELVRFIPEEELVPGVATWKPSICPLCPAGCGVIARVMEGEAEVVRNDRPGLIRMGLVRKLEGNPAHPVSRGKLCVRGQAAVQVTYHPDRIRQPLKRSGPRGAGRFEPATWDQALAELVSRLDALGSAGAERALAYLMRPARGLRRELVARFLSGFGAGPPLTFELFGDDVLRRANAISFGRAQMPTFDLARARTVLSLGADFLGTWNSPVAQNAAYGEMRQGRQGIRGRLVQVEPRMSLTGAGADEWLPIRPGTEGVLALGLAHVILNAKLRPADSAGHAGAVVSGWSAGLPAHTPAEVERVTGIAAARVERLARQLVDERPSVAIVGGAPLAHTNGLFHALAVNALDALLGSVGEPGGVSFTPQPTLTVAGAPVDLRRGSGPSIETWAAGIVSAEPPSVQVLLIDDANPVFATPPAWRVRDALMKIPFIASFGCFLDETSTLADLIVPDHSFLESWADDVAESGATIAVASLAPPAMRPLHQTRAVPDVLLEVGRRLRRPLNPTLPWQTFEEMLNAAFATLPSPAPAPGEAPADVWAAAQEQGGWWGGTSAGPVPADDRSSAPAGPTEFVEARFAGDAAAFPFHFLPYASQAFLDGSLAHLPWLQELPDPLTTAMWCSWVEINPRTAERLGIAQGDLVEVTSPQGALRAPALVSPGLAPDVVAMPVGQGHETFTRYASGRGANPISILAPVTEPETGALAWAATRVRVARVGDGSRDLILFAGALTERPFAREGR